MKYNYDSKHECFVREDGLGKRIWINSIEGQRIMTLYNLDNSISEIRNKIQFNSRKVGESTIIAFIKNVNNGDIVIPSDAPLPVNESLTVEERIQSLEDRLSDLESKVSSDESESFISLLRSKFNHG